MTKTFVHVLIGINNCTLLVYHTDARCWQFRVIGNDGSVYGECKIYYTAQAAIEGGREWVVGRLKIINMMKVMPEYRNIA